MFRKLLKVFDILYCKQKTFAAQSISKIMKKWIQRRNPRISTDIKDAGI